MMRPSLAALVALSLAAALPACAQRSGAHPVAAFRSAPAVHASPAFRSGIAPVTTMHSYARPFIPSARAYPASPLQRFAQPTLRYPTIAPPRAPAFYQKNPTYTARRRGSRVILTPYPASVIGFLPYTGFSDDDLSDTSQPTAPQQPDYNQYPAYPDYYAGYPSGPQYQPYPANEPPTLVAAAAPAAPDTVTLIFNNGRPPEQIQNYLATRTTLTVIDGTHHRDIPVAALDLAATVKANRDAGVDFQLPPQAQ